MLECGVVLWNPANPVVREFFQQTQVAAMRLGVTLQTVIEIRQADVLKSAYSTLANAHPDAMMVLADRALLAHRAQIVDFAANNRLS